MSRQKIRTMLINMATGYWDDRSSSKVPDELKVMFDDGTKAMYRRIVEQPHPSFVKAIGNIRTGYKYGYVGKHAKK
ncbi:MAG: hypothetical protein J6S83_02720 [Lachnospiraceae bacterium]|nr:hypothetical protein [Lachnospiraceae bacterium]